MGDSRFMALFVLCPGCLLNATSAASSIDCSTTTNREFVKFAPAGAMLFSNCLWDLIDHPVAPGTELGQFIYQLERENRRLIGRCDIPLNEPEDIETENERLRHRANHVTHNAHNDTTSHDAIPTAGRGNHLL
jgi:hypothetical protein